MPESSDPQARLDYLQHIGSLLWPPPATMVVTNSRAQTSGTVSEFLLLAGTRHPRLLLPAHHPRAAATAVRTYGEQPSTWTRLLARGAAATLRCGVAQRAAGHRVRVVAPPDAARDDIQTYLSGVLDQPLEVSLTLSAARANRKPVLAALNSSGKLVAFVKVGIDPLTRALVEHENEALQKVAALPGVRFTTPVVLSHDVWHDLNVLVLSPLPTATRRVDDDSQRHEAARQLADSCRQRAVLGVSPWWRRLVERHVSLATDDEAEALRRLQSRTNELAGNVVTSFGPAHGDWTRWNAAVTARRGVLVWDWERFEADAPVGLDALHFGLQDNIVRGNMPLARALADTLRAAPQLLAPFGLAECEATLLPALYLLDIGTRYRLDKQAQAGAGVGHIGEWLLPALDDYVEGHLRRATGGARC